ncbi:MAG: UDP-N-acetylmuramate--L-alanine ligase [Phototrophicaceae bacterium]
MIFDGIKQVHFVGIGGFGLSAIARVLLERGYQVSGSDRAMNDLMRALQRDGATIYVGHAAEQIGQAQLLIISSAVGMDNVEIVAAHERGIPVHKRMSILAPLMAERHVVAIAGTHGKTTTTAMTIHLLQQLALQPGYIVGGVMANTGTNGGDGAGETFVIEADEYDNAFLGLYPQVAVVTSLEYDHPDFFPSLEAMQSSFTQFVNRLPRDHGVLLVCKDDDGAWALAQAVRPTRPLIFSYGLDEGATLRAVNLQHEPDGTQSFEVHMGGQSFGRASLLLPGLHNVRNALAALYVASAGHDLPLLSVIPHLATFKGTGRRFEIRGEVDQIIVIDDYAHHPTAIQTTLDAARRKYPQHTLWAVWQPHTYSRTQSLMAEYCQSFEQADHVIVTAIFAAREAPIDGVTHHTVVASMGHPHAIALDTLPQATEYLLATVTSPSVILIMSAGDAPRIGEMFLQHKQHKDA